ncbi:MAG: hypothetical protein RLY86_1526 [Pseudomonadota bacterium]
MTQSSPLPAPLPTHRRSRIDEEGIADLVVAFYARARHDHVLGPVFLSALGPEGPEWIPHLERVAAFWSSVMLASGRYLGRPMQAHAALPGLSPDHFDRWLTLFEATAADLFQEREATAFALRARRMAAALEQGIGLSRDGDPGSGAAQTS